MSPVRRTHSEWSVFEPACILILDARCDRFLEMCEKVLAGNMVSTVGHMQGLQFEDLCLNKDTFGGVLVHVRI